ncbi:BnaA07g09650D [Brassica napus]|uniref:BnaA07g09650D protein n=1 Tax=Brassica napus TaxID=3708 RepID=A0A078GL02_BRANA|nr:BnaA07g09650D [Brassica napus]
MGRPDFPLPLFEKILPENQEQDYVYGTFAFPLLELGHLTEPEKVARKGNEINKTTLGLINAKIHGRMVSFMGLLLFLKVIEASDLQLDVFNEIWYTLLLLTGQSSTVRSFLLHRRSALAPLLRGQKRPPWWRTHGRRHALARLSGWLLFFHGGGAAAQIMESKKRVISRALPPLSPCY